MPKFKIDTPDGKSYTIEGDDAAGALNALKKHRGEIPEPDQYQQAAIEEDKALGGTNQAGFTRRLAHGATLGADTTLLAAATTPLEMIKHGTFDPREGYNYAKAREDLIMKKSRDDTGMLGMVPEVLGGGVAAGGLAQAGATAARFIPQGLTGAKAFLAGSAAAGADAAAIGGVSGAMEGNGLAERATNAGIGAAVGGAIGSATPGVITALKLLATPITSQIAARFNPKQYAEAQVARAISEGKTTPQEVELAMLHAQNEGQGVFTLADALGHPGQRMLSTVARSPGEGRTAVVDALNSRQGDQGRRLTGAFQEAFDSPQTAEQTRAGLVKQANTEAGVNYAPVKAETQPIDVSQPVAIANRAISPAADNLAVAQGAVPTDIAARSGIEKSEAALRDPIGRAVSEARSYLAAPTLTSSNVGKAFRAKTNIDQMIAKAAENKQGALVAELTPIREALDEQLAKTSSNYAKARDAYKARQQRIEALDKGKEVGSKAGNPQDAIDQFNPLDAEGKQAFRAGYVDPQISQIRNSAFGTDKARPFSSDAVKQEIEAFAVPGRSDALMRKLDRENVMTQTRNHSLSGSKTVENLNDDAAMSVAPEVFGVVKNIVGGNFGSAVKSALAAGHNAFSGNTPAVRNEVAKILLQNGKTIPDKRLEAMIDAVIRRSERASEIADNIRRGLVGGAAVTGGGQRRQ